MIKSDRWIRRMAQEHDMIIRTRKRPKIYANEGLCQILFFQSDEVCETSYKDRKGKYQAQKGIVLPKL